MCGNTRFAAFLNLGYCQSFCAAVEFRFLESIKNPQTAGLLLAQAELVDDILIAIGIVRFEVVEQATSLADHHEKSAA